MKFKKILNNIIWISCYILSFVALVPVFTNCIMPMFGSSIDISYSGDEFLIEMILCFVFFFIFIFLANKLRKYFKSLNNLQ
ncbi:MAG: hypothetical protein [Podoviridae sp. ctcf755]|nr:MAG: hypothetical protein [Podoviridae sp. ctcf755]